MDYQTRLSRAFRLSDDTWRRHANPWSVWTRFAAIPAMILAVWSRAWIGWWAVGPVAAVVVWLAVNPIIFKPVQSPHSWAAKGIYGEKLWLHEGSKVPPSYRTVLRWLIATGGVGFVFLAGGLWSLNIWSTLYGATLLILAQLGRIDRMGLLYQEVGATESADQKNGERTP